MRQISGIGSSFTFPFLTSSKLTADRQRFSCSDDIHPYVALCSAASEAIVVHDGTDDRFNISIRIQAYKIGIVVLP
jgi:hypothetical protein